MRAILRLTRDPRIPVAERHVLTTPNLGEMNANDLVANRCLHIVVREHDNQYGFDAKLRK